MAAKASPVWAARSSLPVTYSCLKTIKDAYTARRYTYDVKFDKVSHCSGIGTKCNLKQISINHGKD